MRLPHRMRVPFDRPHVVAGLVAGILSIGGPLASPVATQDFPRALSEALDLAGAGDLDDAISLVEALCAEDGAPDAAFGLLGSLHVEAGNMERAMEVLGPLAAQEPADPGVLYNAGRATEALGRLQDAGLYYRRSLAIEPRSPALRSLGMLLGRIGRPSEAYAFLQPWTAANPDDHEARMAAAAGAVALERAPDAEALLEGLPEEDPGVKMLRAQVLLQRADPWGAINELRLLAQEPPAAIAGAVRRILARAYLIVGDAEAALEQTNSIRSSGPEDAVLVASAYFQAGRLTEAIEVLAPYAEPLPNSPPPENPPPVARDIVLEYGRYLHSAGEAGRAVPFLRLATELAPDTPDAYQALGQALAATGERERAREVLQRFQDLSRQTTNEVDSVNRARRDIADPTGREVRAALELAVGGELDEALGILAREAQLAPDDPRPAYAASALLLDAGRMEEALAAADRALAAAPGRADGLYQRGAVLISLDRLLEAEEMFRQALEAQPTHPAVLADYAVLLMGGGRNGEARELLERLLEIRPGDAMALGHLERIGGPANDDRNDERPAAQTGRQHMANRRFEAAEEPLRQAVAAVPNDASLRIDLATVLWENNKPAEAELHAREATALQPAVGRAHRMLGGLLLWRGEHVGAAEALERAQALAAPDASLQVELGRAWDGAAGSASGATEEEGRLARAETAYRRAVELDPEHSEAAYGLAQVLSRLGRNEEAAAEMERYGELYRKDQQETRKNGLTDALPSPPLD